MNLMTRRTFVSTALAAGAAAALGRVARAAEPPARTAPPAANGFRIFVCDWTMKLPCDPAAFALAAQIGLDGVQVEFGLPPATGGGPLPLLTEARQDQLLEAAAKHAVPICSAAMGAISGVAPYKHSPVAEQWVLDSVPALQRMKLRLALLPFFGPGDLNGDAAGTAEVIRRLKTLAPRAEAAGVVFGLESWLKAPELERILDAVGSPAIRVYYDVGNMHKVGEDVGAAIRRLGHERICEVHLKDYENIYGQGTIDFPAVRAALDAAGYRGWIGIEGTKLPYGVEDSIRRNLSYLRPLFPKTV